MAFKGEISAAILAGKKTGFATGDIYRIISEGKLGDLDVQYGTFVEWKGTAWEVKKDMQYAVSKTGESLDQAVADVLDDHDTAGQEEELTMPAAEAANYTVGNYFEQNGEVWKCTDKTDNGDGTWTIEADKVNGVVPVLNTLVGASKPYEDISSSITIETNSSLTPISVKSRQILTIDVTCNNLTDKIMTFHCEPDSYIIVRKSNRYSHVGIFVKDATGTTNIGLKMSRYAYDFGRSLSGVLTGSGCGDITSFDDLSYVNVLDSGTSLTGRNVTADIDHYVIIHVISKSLAIMQGYDT